MLLSDTSDCWLEAQACEAILHPIIKASFVRSLNTTEQPASWAAAEIDIASSHTR
jgi:hypothetical protein